MENVISARRLRKSMLNDINYDTYVGNYDIKLNKNHKKKLGLKDKFMIQAVISSVILFATIFIVNNYKENALNNKIINRLYEHYKFNFTKEVILNNFEEGIKSIDKVTGDIIPKKIKEGIVRIYQNNIKNLILNFSILKDTNNEQVNIYSYDEQLNENNVINSSEVSLDITNSLKNMNFIKPTEGIISSRFGDREEIFEGVNPYHTGIDIASDLGKDVISASDGIVEKAVHDDKYYGNYILIKMDDILFKYAHLSEILISEGDVIKQGMVIGKIGSTGMSTGPHLHFEILQNNVAIDPESVIEF